MKVFQLIHHWKILGIYRIIDHDTLSYIGSFRSRTDQRLEANGLWGWPGVAIEEDRRVSIYCSYVTSADSTLLPLQGIRISWKHLLIRLVDYRYAITRDLTNAAFNPNPLSETQSSCSTDNCTWPSFTSLKFCSKCEDISRSLRDSKTDIDPRFECSQDEDLWYSDKKNSSGCQPVYRNYTYTFPKFNGQHLMIVDHGSETYNRSFNIRLNAVKTIEDFRFPLYFLVFPLDLEHGLPLTFTDGTSIPMDELIGFIWLSQENPSLGDVLAADVCALSFCAQKRNVSVSLNQLSSTIIQTVYGNTITYESDSENYYFSDVLSFIGDDFNITFPPQPTKLHLQGSFYISDEGVLDFQLPLILWQDNLRSLMRYECCERPGHLLGSIFYQSSANFRREAELFAFKYSNAFNASSNISMTM